MTASAPDARSILQDWQNNSQQLEAKIWSNGMDATQFGTVVRNDHEAFIIANSNGKFHIGTNEIAEVKVARPDRLQLLLHSGLNVLICPIS